MLPVNNKENELLAWANKQFANSIEQVNIGLLPAQTQVHVQETLRLLKEKEVPYLIYDELSTPVNDNTLNQAENSLDETLGTLELNFVIKKENGLVKKGYFFFFTTGELQLMVKDGRKFMVWENLEADLEQFYTIRTQLFSDHDFFKQEPEALPKKRAKKCQPCQAKTQGYEDKFSKVPAWFVAEFPTKTIELLKNLLSWLEKTDTSYSISFSKTRLEKSFKFQSYLLLCFCRPSADKLTQHRVTFYQTSMVRFRRELPLKKGTEVYLSQPDLILTTIETIFTSNASPGELPQTTV